MTCQEFWSRMPELKSGQQQFDHVRQCASCAALLERQRALSAGLRRMAAERHIVEAPAHLEARLRAEFHSGAGQPATSPPIHPWVSHPWVSHWWAPRRWVPGWAQRGLWVPAVAALLALAVFLVWEQRTQPAGPAPAHIASLAGDYTASMDSGFIPLPYAEATSAPDDVDRVEIEVPRATLIALGIPMPEGDAREAVEAEVLLGAGGTPQAVRLLQ
jgi:hypothetical protein